MVFKNKIIVKFMKIMEVEHCMAAGVEERDKIFINNICLLQGKRKTKRKYIQEKCLFNVEITFLLMNSMEIF